MTTANDLIAGALRFINVLASGEPLSSDDANDSLATLNDLLESLSTDQGAIFCSQERVFTFTPGQLQYSIGNYDAGEFPGTVTSGSPTITAATVPANMVAGGDLTGAGIAEGTTIVSFNSGAGTITMSANGTTSPGAQQIAYTIPGDFKATRPLRITQAFTRITSQNTGLDYPIDIIDKNKYSAIGYKALSGPWPIMCWYNRTFPLGTLYFYQNPSDAGELHLFCDEILTSLEDLTTEINLPQGYSRYLKRKLARELAPEYGKEWTALNEKLAKEAEDHVKSLNMVPVEVSNYDPELNIGPSSDAGWIMHGGFR